MSWLNPWYVRVFAAASIVAGFIFMFWGTVLPFGVFQISSADPSPSATFISVVVYAGQQEEIIIPVRRIEIGWSGIWVAYQYVVFGLLFGVMIGWLPGELVGRQSAFKKALDKVKSENLQAKVDLILRECEAEGMIRDAHAFRTQSQQLKKEVKKMRGEIFLLNQSAKEQFEINEKLRRKAASAEKELAKAKAKIRRLTGKSNRRTGIPVDGGQQPE
jgi:signal transduction histidine kinase